MNHNSVPGEEPSVVILFVDDEEKSLKYFKRLFGAGRMILTAGDGAEGLEVVRENPRIDLVITDHIMPRMTGLEMLERIRNQGLPMTRVLSTAFTDTDLISNAVESGLIDQLISKPWDLGEVEALISLAAANAAAGRNRLAIGDGQAG